MNYFILLSQKPYEIGPIFSHIVKKRKWKARVELYLEEAKLGLELKHAVLCPYLWFHAAFLKDFHLFYCIWYSMSVK